MASRRPSDAAGVRAKRLGQLVREPTPVKALAARCHGAGGDGQPQIRILIADYQPASLCRLRELLTAQTDFMIVGEARNGDEVVALATELKPDILLLGFSATAGGLELLERLRTEPALRTILLTAGTVRSDIVNLVKLGARGIVSQDSSARHLFKSIRSVFKGDIWLKREDFAEVVEALTIASGTASVESPVRLTARQREVLALVVSGGTNREVARKLSVSEDTVKHHITNILDRTGMSSRVELAVFAIERRLVKTA